MNDRARPGALADDRRYPSRPFVGVGAVVFKGADVLLIQRGKPPRQGQWSLPGGLQRVGETVFEAGVREVREETGLTVEPIALIDVVDSITRDENGRPQYHYTLVDILAEWRAGEAVAGDDAAAVAWTALDDLARFRLWSESERIIHLAATKRRA
ncbi:MAG: NUDIX domain-containing protein [Alphaproteobacteria bacterium]|nr:NUDIX domain-containing protein [Alphaproteobacteria bacterium]